MSLLMDSSCFWFDRVGNWTKRSSHCSDIGSSEPEICISPYLSSGFCINEWVRFWWFKSLSCCFSFLHVSVYFTSPISWGCCFQEFFSWASIWRRILCIPHNWSVWLSCALLLMTPLTAVNMNFCVFSIYLSYNWQTFPLNGENDENDDRIIICFLLTFPFICTCFLCFSYFQTFINLIV